MKKRLLTLGIEFLLLLSVISAQESEPIIEDVPLGIPPIIDGIVVFGEWFDANVKTIEFESGDGKAERYLKYYSEIFYFALVIEGESEVFYLWLGDDEAQAFNKGTDIKICPKSAGYTCSDWYYKEMYDFVEDDQQDVKGVGTYDADRNETTVEFEIPFNSGDINDYEIEYDKVFTIIYVSTHKSSPDTCYKKGERVLISEVEEIRELSDKCDELWHECEKLSKQSEELKKEYEKLGNEYDELRNRKHWRSPEYWRKRAEYKKKEAEYWRKIAEFWRKRAEYWKKKTEYWRKIAEFWRKSAEDLKKAGNQEEAQKAEEEAEKAEKDAQKAEEDAQEAEKKAEEAEKKAEEAEKEAKVAKEEIEEEAEEKGGEEVEEETEEKGGEEGKTYCIIVVIIFSGGVLVIILILRK